MSMGILLILLIQMDFKEVGRIVDVLREEEISLLHQRHPEVAHPLKMGTTRVKQSYAGANRDV